MSLYSHIVGKLMHRDNLWFTLLFAIFGITIAFEEKTIYPIFILITSAFGIVLTYSILKGIKSWRFESDIRKLSPAERAQLFDDVLNQAKWDSSIKKVLNEYLDKDK